jgi:hypothetical protein
LSVLAKIYKYVVSKFSFVLSFSLTIFFIFLGLQPKFCAANCAYCSFIAQGFNHRLDI